MGVDAHARELAPSALLLPVVCLNLVICHKALLAGMAAVEFTGLTASPSHPN